MKKTIKITIKESSTIKDALKLQTKLGEKCLIVLDENGTFLGTLSDGDIRRAILNGQKTSTSIESIFNRNSIFIEMKNYNKAIATTIFHEKKIDCIPILDKKRNLIKVVFWADLLKDPPKGKLKMDFPVVIMAGGKGTRLLPITKILPKPLVPVNEKPIIEHIIDYFKSSGFNNFYLTTNYKAKMIKAYFDGLEPNYFVKTIKEEKPLGTAGSLSLIKEKFNKPIFVTNCDILIKADYKTIYENHIKGKNDITIVASAKEYIIPYGTCVLDKNGLLEKINEKPKYDFLINTGFYLLNPEILKLIPKNKFFHITDLFYEAKKLNKKIGVFPISENAWIDIGQWAEYQKAVKIL